MAAGVMDEDVAIGTSVRSGDVDIFYRRFGTLNPAARRC